MELQTSVLTFDTPVTRTVSQSSVNCEIPLPDGRDAARVLSANALLTLEDAQCQSGGVRVAGQLDAYFVCESMAGDVYGFTASSGFSHAIEDAHIEADCQAKVTGQTVEVSARPDGMRLRLSATIEFDALVTTQVTTPVITDVIGNAEKRRAELTMSRCVPLAQASVSIREEADAKGVLRVLLAFGAARIESLAYSGASVCEATGELFVSALCETESGENRTVCLNLPFVCSLDAPFAANVWAYAQVSDISVIAADVSFGVLDVSAVIKVTLMGVEQEACAVLLDCYEETGRVQCVRESFARIGCMGMETAFAEISESVAIPKHLPEAMQATYAACMPVALGVFEKDGMLCADVMLLTSVICRADDGVLFGFTEDIPVQIAFDTPFTNDAVVTAQSLCTTASGSGRTISVSYRLQANALLYAVEPIALATELRDDGEVCPYHGVLIYCAEAGETVWDVGKRFHAPLSSLRTWNVDLCDPLPEGRAIVLMK